MARNSRTLKVAQWGVIPLLLTVAALISFIGGTDACQLANALEKVREPYGAWCFEFWFNRYQTMLAGTLALAGAAVAFIVGRDQIREMRRQQASAVATREIDGLEQRRAAARLLELELRDTFTTFINIRAAMIAAEATLPMGRWGEINRRVDREADSVQDAYVRARDFIRRIRDLASRTGSDEVEGSMFEVQRAFEQAEHHFHFWMKRHPAWPIVDSRGMLDPNARNELDRFVADHEEARTLLLQRTNELRVYASRAHWTLNGRVEAAKLR